MARKIIASSDTLSMKMPGSAISTSQTKAKAQTINYEELKRLLVQNVSKNTSRTYIQYTKENIQAYLQSPLANIDNIRLVSQFLYRVSAPYKIIVNYFANLGTFSYNVVYKTDLNKPDQNQKKFIKNYQTILERLESMRLKDEMPNVVATAIRDGAFFGFCYDDEKTFFINALDPKYCKINSIRDGVCDFSFNASFFDQGNNKYYIDSSLNPDGLWDQIFIDGYNTYKAQGRDAMWFDIPPEKGMCVIASDDPICPLPYFTAVFVELLDLLDYRDLIKSKTELDNTVLLLSKIPLLDGSKEVNDFAVDLDLVQATQAVIDEVAPSLAATAYTPCEVEAITFNNENQVQQANIYNEALSNLMSNIGISEMLFNPAKNGSVGLNASIQEDEMVFFRFLSKIESWIKRYIALNISSDFLFKFHYVTGYSKDRAADKLKEAATLGLPVKLDYATILGYTPYQIMQQTYFEDSLGIMIMWKPLASSFNGGTGEVGAPQKPDDELTEEGEDTRSAGKNEGTKAKKELNEATPKKRGRPRKS